MIGFRRQGHWVCSLSQQDGFLIHDFLRTHGIETRSFVVRGISGWRRHWKHLKFLVTFCWRERVDIVYSHLEYANFIAAIAQFFIPSKVFLCRHHADQYKFLSLDRDWSYRITYTLAKRVIAFSDRTREFMIREERIPSNRIIRINLGYDFSIYPPVRTEHVERLKKKYNAELLIVTVGNFLPLKRPEASIHVVKSLRDEGLDAKLVLLGQGELERSLTDLAHRLGLAECVFFPGYVDNVLEYLAASSFVLHPSISEASCVSIKEAGLVGRPVVVCERVGDFDEYITHGENGFLVSADNFEEEARVIIREYRFEALKLAQIGQRLKESVTSRFGIENVLPCYDTINRIQK
jgi:glycosyltransferase involved in cell wall biosynthesis